MNEPPSEPSSVLSFSCPRCGHEHDDEYEVIDAARPTDWRCAACNHVFSVLLTECWHCAAETVTVALAEWASLARQASGSSVTGTCSITIEFILVPQEQRTTPKSRVPASRASTV